jgi:protein O-mannosyl-transferase
LRPEDADTLTALGMVLLEQGRIDEAATRFEAATEIAGTNAVAHHNLGLIRQSRGETASAMDAYRKAIEHSPDWPEPLNNLAWLLAANSNPALRNGAEAVTFAERACRLTGYQHPLLVGTLGAAYAEAGRFDDAVAAATKARELALAAGQKELAKRNEELLELYRAGKAYHEGR